ncbi:hypothetical protein DICA2_C05996 [Diutina catenulata]
MVLVRYAVAVLGMLIISQALLEEQASVEFVAPRPTASAEILSRTPNYWQFMSYVHGDDSKVYLSKKSTVTKRDKRQKKAVACRNASIKWIHVGKWAKQANDEIIKAIQSSSGMSGSGNCNREIQILDAAEHFIPFYLRPESSCGYDENWDSVLKVIRKIMDEKPKSLPLAMCIVASDEADRSYSITFGFDAIAVGSINCHQGMEAKHCHWIK